MSSVQNNSLSFILLTYKSKLLLVVPDFDPSGMIEPVWVLMNTTSTASSKKKLLDQVLFETHLSFHNENVQIDTYKPSENATVYHVRLTDQNVNNIQRRDRQKLEFFTFKELAKLRLSDSTRDLFNEHSALFQELLHN